MEKSDRTKELSHYYLRLQHSHDITSFTYLQNILTFLCAKTFIEAIKNSRGDAGNSLHITDNDFLTFERIIADFFKAAKDLLPAFYRQLPLDNMVSEIKRVIMADDGLKRCYDFLQIKSPNTERKLLFSFESTRLTKCVYDESRNEAITNYPSLHNLLFYETASDFELQIQDKVTNNLVRVTQLRSELEGFGFIIYSNTEVQIKIDLERFVIPQIFSISVSDRMEHWSFKYT